MNVDRARFKTLIRLKNIFALLLLAFWPVMSAHPVLEYLGLIHEAHADHGHDLDGSHHGPGHDGDHDAADGRCLLASTVVKAPAPHYAFSVFLICHLASDWVRDFERQQLAPGPAPPSLVPPELAHRWQFSFRTALPARAPSFVS